MSRTLLAFLPWLAAAIAFALVARALARIETRRTVFKFRPRLDRYKLTRKKFIVQTLIAEPELAAAVDAHVRDAGITHAAAWKRVHTYLDEIVPFFNLLAYYRFGYSVSRVLLNLFYRVSVEYERPDPFRALRRDAIVIYLMNHRSNADYIVVSYALAGDVSLSYAVGEWARAFPLEYIFKTFGSYFVRRKYREPLYHAVLSQYVQLITRNGVTQGIFPEGGLSRDGKLQPAKIGLLDYALSVARDTQLRDRMYLVPVGINYDRVLEDRSLLRELAARQGRRRPSRLTQLGEVSRYVGWNVARMITRRWKRYGRAAVAIGTPVSVGAWLAHLESQGIDPLCAERTVRLGHVQALCDQMMERVGAVIPVTPVALVCAALQTFDADFVPKAALLDRLDELRGLLGEINARVIRSEVSVADVFDRAYRMLRMRRVVARAGSGYLILPAGRPLISYYANSIAHLLGPYAAGIRARDALPMEQATGQG